MLRCVKSSVYADFQLNLTTLVSEAVKEAQSQHKSRIRDKLQEYRPLAKAEELLEENYNQIDNQLSNTASGDDAAEKRKREAR